MENLIKITEQAGQQLVNARELHEFLESKRQFGNWIQERIDQGGFIKRQDFITNLLKSTGGRPLIEYGLTLDMSKHLAMMERNEKGKIARQYFVDQEKKLRIIQSGALSRIELAQMVIESETEKQKALEVNKAMKEKMVADQPKVVFADSVSGSENLILIREYAKILSDQGFEIGEKRLYRWFRDNEYLNRNNEPYQRYVQMGLFKVIEHAISRPERTFTRPTTKITGKGQIYFANKLKNAA